MVARRFVAVAVLGLAAGVTACSGSGDTAGAPSTTAATVATTTTTTVAPTTTTTEPISGISVRDPFEPVG